jgi:CheY-like chemotaxis protein/HPt (histidine-containing phosphotransfer) domain-containing protein
MEKHINLSLILSAEIPDALLGDPTRIRQILLNLVDNAIKFTDRGTGRAARRLRAGQWIVHLPFSVEDSGIGISEEAQSQPVPGVYPGRQFHHATLRRDRTGTGGEPPAGGTDGGRTVGPQHQEGQGSCFTLVLTLPGTSLPVVDLPAPSAASLSGRILVVEDHPVNQKVLSHQLQGMGLDFSLAATGIEAIEQFKSNRFDLVLMDWQMPEMDGLEATRRIRRLEAERKVRTTPIIALTANANTGFREHCLAAGANDYLSKPYNESALLAVLTHWLPNEPLQRQAAPTAPTLIDTAALLERYQGNQALVDELASLFVSTTEASLATLREAIEQGDPSRCRKEAHALKGAAASVLARDIQQLAGEIEACGIDQDMRTGRRQARTTRDALPKTSVV